jgi:hypothetical protein
VKRPLEPIYLWQGRQCRIRSVGHGTNSDKCSVQYADKTIDLADRSKLKFLRMGRRVVEKPWLEQAQRLRDAGVKQVYIAIIPDIVGLYCLEIEINEGTIGFTHEVNTRSLRRARKQADSLETVLTGFGIKVWATRDEWEEANQ